MVDEICKEIDIMWENHSISRENVLEKAYEFHESYSTSAEVAWRLAR